MKNPIAPNFRSEWYALAILLLSFLAAFFFRFNLPAQVPIHWNLAGEADNYGSTVFAAWFLPLLSLGLYIFLLIIPRFDPRREQYESFRRYYHYLKDLILSLLLFIYLTTNLKALGYSIDISRAILSALGIFFALLGFVLVKIEPNWFLGIRTPWTLSSSIVWRKTRVLAAYLFPIAGLLFIGSAFLGVAIRQIIFIAALVVLIVPAPLYSYFAYRRENNKGIKQ